MKNSDGHDYMFEPIKAFHRTSFGSMSQAGFLHELVGAYMPINSTQCFPARLANQSIFGIKNDNNIVHIMQSPTAQSLIIL